MLLPCPFCGSSNLRTIDNDWGNPVVNCMRCGADGPPGLDPNTNQEAERLWNIRANATNSESV
jgi:Lar family restriction alleviation protein